LRNRLLHLLTALSVLLCVAVVVLWTAVPKGTAWAVHFASRRYTFRPQPERLWVEVAEGQWANGEFGPPQGKVYRLAVKNRHQFPGGLEWVRNPASDQTEAFWVWVFIPYWILLAATALPPVLWIVRATVRRVRNKRDVRLRLCPKCGYDVRATPDRCPECGTAAP